MTPTLPIQQECPRTDGNTLETLIGRTVRPEDIERVYDTCASRIHKHFAILFHDEPMADWLTFEVFAKLWERTTQTDKKPIETRGVMAWLVRTGQNLYISEWRKK